MSEKKNECAQPCTAGRMEEGKVNKLRLAREFDKRYGKNILRRVAKLAEEVNELVEETARFDTAMKSGGSGDNVMDAFDAVTDELMDVASIVNQLEYLMLTKDWPEKVHKKLLMRDQDPEYGRRHPHERNKEAGE